LVAAILCLVPAINLRRKMLRLQVSDDGPFLGETNMRIGEDGLVIERPMATSKYLWSAIQGVEVTSGGLILPLDNGIGLVIPRNAFAADSELHALSALILRQLEASRSATPS
jgi:hypothetical protein